MSRTHFKYTDKELTELLKTLVIIVDTREQVNEHVRDYFRRHDITYKIQTMKTGDYTAMIPKNEEYGISRDMYLSACLERKNGVDELVQSIKDRNRFEHELWRAKDNPFVLVVEDVDGYRKILNGEYRSAYKPQSLLGSLKTFEARYDFSTVFINPAYTGNYIYHHFHYLAREVLRS
ncbi:ERCC4 domain-containing protein [Alkalihalophilus marmarensis]|jgi:ERCC4-type nuclease|uniref:ERCC4-type nuclease n=1 Tax=Alkalihalophilus marmarensis DSM 21297 TaxID=1188261 RepID=U6SQ67_9BACI|nr:ERCC4 domain-containing protein [Alkalihalophilus marmarensis]ERN52796.1 ERCC4-type nuclease [Alkalihalophilus marmarensis DSM 21297]MCM3489098.1 ERCC4 domain-containing protein [Alkalihalophilus marmarensis]